MIFLVGFSLLLFYKGVLCEQVIQSSLEQMVASGSKVTLLCTYDTLYSNPDLYWYRIRSDHSFQFILYRDNTRSRNADFTQGRFSVLHNQSQKTFHLVISQVEPEDSATYYCAIDTHSDTVVQDV
ncbi:T cell receptor delta variable 3 [Vulpes lagopus]